MKILYKIDRRINNILDKLFIWYLILFKGVEIGVNPNISRKAVFSILYGSVKIGDNCIIEPKDRFKSSQNVNLQSKVINIESNVFIGYGSIIDANCSVKIGTYTMIGPYVFITDSEHILKQKDIPIAEQGGLFEPVEIGRNVWIGSQSQILKGVLIAGVPAIFKKMLFI